MTESASHESRGANREDENTAEPKKRLITSPQKRWIIWGSAALLIILLGATAWVGLRGLQAKSDLETAQGLIGKLKAQTLAFDVGGANATLETISAHTRSARDLTDDFVWRTGELVPLAGPNLRAFRQLASVTDSVIVDVATPLIRVVSTIDPAALAPKDGAIDVQPLVDAVPAVKKANAGMKSAVSASDEIDTSGTLSQVTDAHKKIDAMLSGLAPVLQQADQILPLVGPALGADAPRRYVVMFQNNAELRSLGGAALSFAVVTMDNGKIELGDTVSPSTGVLAGFSAPPSEIPDGVLDVYPGYGTSIINATSRPSFTSAAEITDQKWFEHFGYHVDGVISIDPVALSYVLRATAPITLSTGDILTADTLVPILLNQVYLRFTSKNVDANNLAQDKIFGEAIGATFKALTAGGLDVKKLLGAVTQGWDERRILYWSANDAEQVELAEIGLNGELPVNDKKTERVGVYFQDAVGSKLNYYLQQRVTLGQATCRTDGNDSYRVSVDLHSTLPAAGVSNLPFHVTGEWRREGLKPGVQRLNTLLYAPEGMRIVGASVNGKPVELAALHDATWGVGKIIVEVQPEKTMNITYDLVAATGKSVFEAQVTPTVAGTPIATAALDCATVPAG